jgi:hypothetical protein
MRCLVVRLAILVALALQVLFVFRVQRQLYVLPGLGQLLSEHNRHLLAVHALLEPVKTLVLLRLLLESPFPSLRCV